MHNRRRVLLVHVNAAAEYDGKSQKYVAENLSAHNIEKRSQQSQQLSDADKNEEVITKHECEADRCMI